MIAVAMITIVCALYCQAKSHPRCLFQPLPGPEVDYDFYDCSYVLDWSHNFPKNCKDEAIRYEIEFIYGCTNDSLRSRNFTIEEHFRMPDEVLKLCSVGSSCYARVRAQLSDESWSEYSAWVTLSDHDRQHEILQAYCVIKGSDLCLPIQANCDGGILPEFVIDQMHYLFQELFGSINNQVKVNTTYDPVRPGYDICFKNVTTSILYIEFCPSHPTCTMFSPSTDGELKISKRAVVQVRTDHCSTCSYATSNLQNLTSAIPLQNAANNIIQGNQCVVVDFTGSDMDMEIASQSRNSICVSIVSPVPENIFPSTEIHLNLRINGTGTTSRLNTSNPVLLNASQTIHCEEIYISNQNSIELQIQLIETDTKSIVYLPRPCITTVMSKIDSTERSPKNKAHTRKLSIFTILMMIVIVLSIFFK